MKDLCKHKEHTACAGEDEIPRDGNGMRSLIVKHPWSTARHKRSYIVESSDVTIEYEGLIRETFPLWTLFGVEW